MPIRVLVVDDSAFMRTMLTRFLTGAAGIEVIGTAANGRLGVEKAKSLKPDVMTLDIEMPEMDGLTALKALRKEFGRTGPSVLMCSSLTADGSHETLEALKRGAADFIAKDPSASADHTKFGRELVMKVRAISKHKRDRSETAHKPVRSAPANPPASSPASSFELESFRPSAFDMVVIGSSTGGPPMLEKLVDAIPEHIGVPVVIAQHMPSIFTRSMSQRLNAQAAVRVRHADSRVPLLGGNVYIIEGGRHGTILGSSGGRLRLDIIDEVDGAHFMPSVDELMRSAAKACGPRVLGLMLTGMGDDGCLGAKVLKERGGILLAQDESSCVVYGMPRAVAEAGLVDAVLTPEQFVGVLERFDTKADQAAA